MHKRFLSKNIVLWLFLFSANILLGQSKYVQKSKKLYEKKEFEKCIATSKKNLSKDRKSVDLQYYIVISNLALHEQNKSKTKKYSYLKKSVSAWKKLEKYNSKKKDFSKTEEDIRIAIHSFSETNYILQNRQKNQILQDLLAKVFADTTDIYRSIHYIPTKENKLTVDESIIDSRKLLLKNAVHLIGVEYKYGGTDTTGFDCSGFTQYIYKSIGIDIPHNANQQSKIGKDVKLKNAKAGDLIFFGNKSAFHAGVIFKNNKGKIELIHCVSGGVNHQDYKSENTKYWLKNVLCVKQLIED